MTRNVEVRKSWIDRSVVRNIPIIPGKNFCVSEKVRNFAAALAKPLTELAWNRAKERENRGCFVGT